MPLGSGLFDHLVGAPACVGNALATTCTSPSLYIPTSAIWGVVGERAGEGRPGKLAALVGVEDVRLAVTRERVFQCLHAERGIHRDRQPPRQHAAAEPVEYYGQIDESACHRDVGDVHRPDLVRPCDFDAVQQIGIDLVPRLWLGRARTAIECFYPHPLHQRFDMSTADLAPLGDQQASQHPRTGEGVLQMQPVETPHDREVGVRHRPRQVVDTAAADVQNLRLPDDRQIVLTVHHRFALSNPALVSAPSKKSFSSVSSPILACSDFMSTAGSAIPPPLPGPNTFAAPPSSCAYDVTWFG